MGAYYPSMKELKNYISNQVEGLIGTSTTTNNIQKFSKNELMFQTDKYLRTDNFDVDKTLSELSKSVIEEPKLHGLLSRTASVSDLTEKLYRALNNNPNTFSNWFDKLKIANKDKSFFKIPETKFMTLPHSLSQFMRVEYQDTNQVSRDAFNKLLFEAFDLDKDKEYFIKTGTFSSKFEFQNAHVDDPEVIGDYFIVINNFAMNVGAGLSNDIVVREYIENTENLPTIYDGMPLRTEFRAFIDFDNNKLLGVVPYWHHKVMKNVLSHQGQFIPSIEKDYQTYLKEEPRLIKEYNENVVEIQKHIEELIPDIDLKGQYSLDVMKNGDDFYLIDMALANDSALTDLLDTPINKPEIKDDWLVNELNK